MTYIPRSRYVASFGGSELITQCGLTVQKQHAGNSVLMDKCANPNCGRSWTGGQCNVECYQGQGTSSELESGCRTAPPGLVRAASLQPAEPTEGPNVGAATIGGGIGLLGAGAFLGLGILTVVTEGRGKKNFNMLLVTKYK